MVAPHGSFEPIFGTNPLAIGIPTNDAQGDPSLVLDMATSAEAWFGLVGGKTRSGHVCPPPSPPADFTTYSVWKVTAKEQGVPIRPDVAFNNKGELTTSAAEALEGALQVFDRWADAIPFLHCLWS